MKPFHRLTIDADRRTMLDRATYQSRAAAQEAAYRLIESWTDRYAERQKALHSARTVGLEATARQSRIDLEFSR